MKSVKHTNENKVIVALQKLKNGKATGFDGTHQDRSRYLTYPSSKIIKCKHGCRMLFYATMDAECYPQQFKRGVTITLFKGGN